MIFVNGRPHELPAGATISELLRALEIDPQRPGIAIAVDAEIATRAEWRTRAVADGARIEIVTATQGG